jgi:TonB-dependent SusC/RagA subfamily outer membrane receptor
MRKIIFSLLILSACSYVTFAQDVKLNKDSTTSLTAPLYIFKLYADDKEYNALPIIALIDQKDIASMEILKDKTADELYGSRGKYGVIIITLIKDVEIHEVDQLLNERKIKPRFKKLPIFVNNTLTRKAKEMFYTYNPNKIKSVSVETEKETGMKYISIITADYNPAPDNQFRIKGTGTSGM